MISDKISTAEMNKIQSRLDLVPGEKIFGLIQVDRKYLSMMANKGDVHLASLKKRENSHVCTGI